jgi:hypothetical protein
MQQNTCNFFFLSYALNLVVAWSTDIFGIDFWSCLHLFSMSEGSPPPSRHRHRTKISYSRIRPLQFFFFIFEFCQCLLCYECYCDERMSWDSLVTATRLRVGLSAKARRQETFFFSKASWPSLWPTQAPDQCVLMALTPGVKQSGREAGYWLPFCCEIYITSLPHTPFLPLPQ